jgi:protein-S-isoprenylcysteine O-methyltransferase Ste14
MFTQPNIIQGILVSVLFVGYSLLWALKRKQQQAATGKNTEVMYQDTRPTQLYFARLSRVMTLIVLLLIGLHMAGLNHVPGFYTVSLLDTSLVNGLGFIIGLIGLSLCWLAQWTMGNAWRVGIDKQNETPLLTDGVFQLVRNPTYRGLFLLCTGVWLIFPTFS